MRVLAGDIGGTKVLLQLADFEPGGCRLVAEQRFDSDAYDDLLPLVRDFLGTVSPTVMPGAACFGIAGPITATPTGQVARVTNLPWIVESGPFAHELAIPQVRLINDFQAVGYGIETLLPQDFVVLQAGEPKKRAPRGVLGAGTGLGQALLVWQDDHYEAVATEGGHVDFAPTDELQVELLRYLGERYERVSYERVLSGPGLVNLYTFLRTHGEPGSLDLLRTDDPPAAITAAALRGGDPAAKAALDMFVKVYGAQAGNVALAYFAAGGLFIAGGIAPKILSALTDGAFIRAFLDKGRMRDPLATFPVYVVINERVGLLGAALAASRLS
jgi:glucokinase